MSNHERLRRGWPATGLVLLPFIPLLLSGPIRAVSGLSLRVSAAIAVALTLAGCWPFRADLAHWAGLSRARLRAREIACVGLAAFGVYLLYNRYFGGLVYYAGGDGGVHVDGAQRFATTTPMVYESCVAMYALIHWIQKIGNVNIFWGFVGAFYFGVAVCMVAPYIAATTALWRFREERPLVYWSGFAAALLAILMTQYLVVLPLEAYHQSDGFFVHVFGLVPLCFLWLADGLIRVRWLRLAALVAGVLFYRYTYALNVADIAVTVAVLFLIESAAVTTLPRVALWAAALAFVGTALVVVTRIRPMFDMYGWIRGYDLPYLTTVQLAGAGVGAIFLLFAPRWNPGCGLTRWLRLPVIFATVNMMDLVGIQQDSPNQPYFVLKYSLHGVVILSCGLAVAAAVTVASLVQRAAARQLERRALVAPLAAIALIGMTLYGWQDVFSPYRPAFLERAFAAPPYTENHPLVDLGAWKRINKVLATEDKKFGGYLTASFPVFNFMNAGLGYYNGGQTFYKGGGHVKEEPGYCVFWEGGKTDWWASWENEFPLRPAWKRLQLELTATCVSYQAHWEPTRSRILCHKCY